MRKILFLLIIAITLSTYSISFGEGLLINGEAAILIDYDTKEVLYEKNINQQLYPASTTKMITAILAIERGNLSDIITIDQEVVDLTKGSHIALEPGEQLTLEQLLYALLVQSANDAALAIAKYVSGSVDAFVALMNEKAIEIGATNTNYVNPNGLHDDRHVSTAHDLALIGQYVMQNETYRKIASTVTYTIEPTNIKTEPRYLKLTNKLLFSSEKVDVNGQLLPAKYDGASGVKTGYTSQAQSCLVSFAEKGDQKLIAVVLKAVGNNVYSDSHKLLNYGFENFKNVYISSKNEFIDNVSVKDGLQPMISGILDKDIVFPLSNSNKNDIEKKVVFKEDLKAPLLRGDIIGNTEFYLDGRLIGQSDIISTMDVELDPKTTLSYKIMSKWYIILLGLFVLLRIAVLANKNKRRSRRRASYRVPYGIK